MEAPENIKVLRVLVADDDDAFRYIARSVLEDMSHDVIEARDGLEALRECLKAIGEGRAFDLVLLDLNMSDTGWNGIETVVRLTELTPRPKIILSTGAADDPIVNYPDSMGFDEMLIKPYPLEALRETVMKLCNK